MSKRIEINAGDRFGRFIVIKEMPKKAKNRYVLCKCDCGNIRNTSLSMLKAGKSKSCGCLKIDLAKKRSFKHGQCFTRLYHCWKGMKKRCLNPKCISYPNYGGRGIKVCNEWMDFEPFYKWAVVNGYKDSLTLERKDNDGNYKPSNCTWIPLAEQLNNTRRNIKLTYKAKTQTLMQWSKELKIAHSTLQRRLQLRWSIEKTLTSPIQVKYSKTKRGGNAR